MRPIMSELNVEWDDHLWNGVGIDYIQVKIIFHFEEKT